MIKQCSLKLKKSLLTIVLTIGLSLTSLLTAGTNAAGSASLSLNPASGNYAINTSFTLTVYENSGAEAVDSASAEVRFESSKLQYESYSFVGSAFDLCVGSTSSGIVDLGCTRSSGTLTGNQVVGKVTFKALAGSGTTAVTFGPSSVIIRNSDAANIWNGSPTGGSYGLTTPTPTPTTTTPAPTPATTPPKPTTTTTSSSTPKTVKPNIAKQQANPEAPVPVIIDVQMSTGYLVAIEVLDSKGKPIEKANVTLDGRSTETDSKGIASFVEIAAGRHDVEVKTAQGTVKSAIDVRNEITPSDVQKFKVSVAVKSSKKLPFIIPLVVGAGTVLLLLLVKRGIPKVLPLPKVSKYTESGKSATEAFSPNIITPTTQPDPLPPKSDNVDL